MKLIKEISFDRAKKISYFDEIREKFKQIKENKPASRVSQLKRLSQLKFYILIDFEDIFDKLDHFKRILDKEPFEFNNFQKEHEKFLSYLESRERKKKLPAIFKKIGNTNEVKGCYFVASIKTDKDRISPSNSSTTLCIKLSYSKELPVEIGEMCEEFYKHRMEMLKKEREELNRMIGLSLDEQNRLLNNLLQNIQLPLPGSFNPTFRLFEDLPSFQPFHLPTSDVINNKLRIEEAIENNLDEIADVKFLNSLMNSAIDQENYELCSRIRDRISKLEKKSPTKNKK